MAGRLRRPGRRTPPPDRLHDGLRRRRHLPHDRARRTLRRPQRSAAFLRPLRHLPTLRRDRLCDASARCERARRPPRDPNRRRDTRYVHRQALHRPRTHERPQALRLDARLARPRRPAHPHQRHLPHPRRPRRHLPQGLHHSRGPHPRRRNPLHRLAPRLLVHNIVEAHFKAHQQTRLKASNHINTRTNTPRTRASTATPHRTPRSLDTSTAPQTDTTETLNRTRRAQPIQSALDARLRAWRKEQAHAAGLPSFFIFSDSVLRDIVLASPASLSDLRSIRGLGPDKLDRFGPAVLELCRTQADLALIL